MAFERKTFDNSYLFNLDGMAATQYKVLTEFIIKSDRIDKNTDAFRGIIEDVKRMQRSSILYTVLMRDDVILCMNKGAGLPRAFTVFEAKDLRTDHKAKVFIDVTSLIKYNNGYFTCKEIDKLVTYLFEALNYLLYFNSTTKLLGNSDISISGTECFVSMFNYIVDYLRIIGYSQNKEKISYLAGLYFLHHMMGKDLDNYSKNIAARVAGISTSDTRAFELYYDKDKDFENISTFIDLVANTFKLKGFTLEVFMHKWIYSYGTGTQFGTELLTSFMNIITSVFVGSYVVNQKQIERCCGASIVKFGNTILKIGVEEFDKRMYMDAAEIDKITARDKNTEALKESLLKRNNIPDDAKLSDKTLVDKSLAKTTATKMVDYFNSCKKQDKISLNARSWIYACVGAMSDSVFGKDTYQSGVMEVIVNTTKKYITDKNKNELNSYLKKEADGFIQNAKKQSDKEKAKKLSTYAIEMRKCVNML